jgi:hypothetical protein
MRGRLTLSILFFLGLCGSAWFNVQQHAQGLQDKKALSDQLATLKNQVQQQPVATPTPSVDPADAPLLAGQSRVSLSVFGANIIVVDPISDLVYGTVKYNGADTIGFTTQSLLAKYPGCKAGALGTLVRTKVSSTPKPTPTPTSSMSSFQQVPRKLSLYLSANVFGLCRRQIRRRRPGGRYRCAQKPGAANH